MLCSLWCLSVSMITSIYSPEKTCLLVFLQKQCPVVLELKSNWLILEYPFQLPSYLMHFPSETYIVSSILYDRKRFTADFIIVTTSPSVVLVLYVETTSLLILWLIPLVYCSTTIVCTKFQRNLTNIPAKVINSNLQFWNAPYILLKSFWQSETSSNFQSFPFPWCNVAFYGHMFNYVIIIWYSWMPSQVALWMLKLL